MTRTEIQQKLEAPEFQAVYSASGCYLLSNGLSVKSSWASLFCLYPISPHTHLWFLLAFTLTLFFNCQCTQLANEKSVQGT